ncbi:hypothetical protein [Clostridium tarantellae]|uniref:Uncharacterized protein n=1 Tax=Clostridium tarantellae TaxID=39493 RepID=A0A6I1MP26_9CLOT|nr:hypothetical protein [Clostridium tarantellae]MPQ44814.1 hypothetical protein [Clostridium tarantellae]
MYIKDLSDELIKFLKYVEHSDDKIAEESKGALVKNINVITNIRKKYDPLADLVLPHITLVFPFESD